MNGDNFDLTQEQIRNALQFFWNDALQIEALPNSGYALAMPLSFPDGWQIIVELRDRTPQGVKVTDRGRTLGWLAQHGQNVETDGLTGNLDRICREYHLQRDGWELFRWLPLPIQGIDLHVFSEGLAAVAFLNYLHKPAGEVPDVADKTLSRVFSERKLDAKRNVALKGKTEREVRVDYLVSLQRPVAFEILRRKGSPISVMEQWGYRWTDLKKVSPSLMPVMLFDPVVQEIDNASRAIGEEVCSLFCAYNETERIHQVLAEAAS